MPSPNSIFRLWKRACGKQWLKGFWLGYPTTGVKATLYDGSYHTVDSSELAFKIAASPGFQERRHAAKPVLLEPIMNVEVTVPDNFMGDIISDFTPNGSRAGD